MQSFCSEVFVHVESQAGSGGCVCYSSLTDEYTETRRRVASGPNERCKNNK